MRGINLCERAVAVAVEFKLVAAPAPVMEVGNAVTIGLTNLEHEGVVAPAAGYHLRQLPPPTVVKLFARNSGIGEAKPSHLVSNN